MIWYGMIICNLNNILYSSFHLHLSSYDIFLLWSCVDYEIWGSHSTDDVDWGLLRYDMKSRYILRSSLKGIWSWQYDRTVLKFGTWTGKEWDMKLCQFFSKKATILFVKIKTNLTRKIMSVTVWKYKTKWALQAHL